MGRRPAHASAYADLVFHVLAHAPPPVGGTLAAASCSFDPRYLEWAHRALPEPAFGAAAEDAELTSRLLGRASEADVARLSCLPFLCSDLSALDRAGGRALAEIGSEVGIEAAIASSLQASKSELLEIVWCTTLLCRAAWGDAYGAVIEPALREAAEVVAPSLEAAIRLAPGLSDRDLSLSFVLGPRGRAYDGQIVVGAPLPWNGQSADTSAVLWLHEHAVSLAHGLHSRSPSSLTEAHRFAESAAVVAVRRCLADHDLDGAYRAWLDGCDLMALEPAPEESTVDRLLSSL